MMQRLALRKPLGGKIKPTVEFVRPAFDAWRGSWV